MSSHGPAEPAELGREPDTRASPAVPRTVTVMLAVIGAVVLAAGVRAAAEIVAPAMLALVLTIAVLPIGASARRHGWPGWLGTLLALVAAYAIVAVLLIGTVICLIKLVDLLPQYTNDAQDLTDDVQADYERIRARGAEFSTAPTKVTGSTIAMLNDTCGNLIQLTQLSWQG